MKSTFWGKSTGVHLKTIFVCKKKGSELLTVIIAITYVGALYKVVDLVGESEDDSNYCHNIGGCIIQGG